MFKVKYKYDVKGKPEIVYAVKRFDDGETYFLMYNFGVSGIGEILTSTSRGRRKYERTG